MDGGSAMQFRHGVLAAALVGASGLGLHSAAAQTPAPAAALSRIGHIVVIFEENRSFDNMFGLFPGANGLAGRRCRGADRPRRQALSVPTAADAHLQLAAED